MGSLHPLLPKLSFTVLLVISEKDGVAEITTIGALFFKKVEDVNLGHAKVLEKSSSLNSLIQDLQFELERINRLIRLLVQPKFNIVAASKAHIFDAKKQIEHAELALNQQIAELDKTETIGLIQYTTITKIDKLAENTFSKEQIEGLEHAAKNLENCLSRLNENINILESEVTRLAKQRTSFVLCYANFLNQGKKDKDESAAEPKKEHSVVNESRTRRSITYYPC